jgi:hypothetical protein
MPQTAPGFGREGLGFAAAAKKSFSFLVDDLSFRLAAEGPTFVRFESDQSFVNVFHGRASYELGVEIGREVAINGDVVDQKFPLGDVIGAQVDPNEIGFRAFTSTSKEKVAEFLDVLATWTRDFAGPALEGRSEFFQRLSDQTKVYSLRLQENQRASELRARANEAWRKKDFAAVINSYEEIDREFETVELKKSEIRRLEYAKQISDVR